MKCFEWKPTESEDTVRRVDEGGVFDAVKLQERANMDEDVVHFHHQSEDAVRVELGQQTGRLTNRCWTVHKGQC